MSGKHRTAGSESSTYLTSAKKPEGTPRMWATSSISCFPFSGLRGLEAGRGIPSLKQSGKSWGETLGFWMAFVINLCQSWGLSALTQGPAVLPALGWGLLLPMGTPGKGATPS